MNQNLTLQEMIAQRNALDAQIRAVANKRNDAIKNILKVMTNFSITMQELEQAQQAQEQPKRRGRKKIEQPAPQTQEQTLTPKVSAQSILSNEGSTETALAPTIMDDDDDPNPVPGPASPN